MIRSGPASQGANAHGALPRSLSGFVGREAELATLATLLIAPDVRLLTIVGPGGVGKTRLAVETVNSLVGAFPDGIVFVSLASTNEADRVPATIAQALALEPRGDRTAGDAIREAVGDHRILLVLDNLEHLLPAGLFLADLLRTCPALIVLATSRTRLDLSGERVYQLDVLSADDARLLFRQRARAQDEGRAWTGDGPTIDAICSRLDRMPLAIELAAARTTTLPAQALLDRLSRPLTVLRNGPRDLPLRHQTMRDTIAWSYALLDDGQKAGFRRLAVFSGGFTLEGAQAVLGEAMDAFDLVEFLVQRSLVVPMAGDFPCPRFTMLESIRQFGVEVLVASGEDEAIRAAHADWLIELGETAIPYYDGPRLYEFFSGVRAEMDNIRAAMRWSVDQRDGTRANRLAGSVWRIWDNTGASWFMSATWRDRMEEGQRWVHAALALREGVPVQHVLEALGGKIFLDLSLGDTGAMQADADDLLHCGMLAGDHLSMMWAYMARSGVALRQGDIIRARLENDRALEEAHKARDPDNQISGVYANRALLELEAGDDAAAEASASMAVVFGEQCGNPHNQMLASTFLSIALYRQARWGEAVRAGIATIEFLEQVREADRAGIAMAITARAAVLAGRVTDAARLVVLAEAIPSFRTEAMAIMQEMLSHVRAEIPAGMLDHERRAESRMTSSDVRALARELVEELERGPDHTAVRRETLSPREVEVLRLIVEGKSNRAIGECLFISERTVERHVFHIMTKLNLESRTAIVAWAVRSGMVA